MSTMPATALLLVRNDIIVIGEFASYADIGSYLGISIDDEGVIHFRGKPQLPSYILDTHPDPRYNGFTKVEAMRDWCKHHMQKNLRDHTIYRFIK